MKKITLNDIKTLSEDFDLEIKKSIGDDGKGAFPRSLLETYSAMANTEGGVILLGLEEKPKGHFKIVGIENIEQVKKALWDTLNNPQRVNFNLLSNADVETIKIDNKNILRINIPRAKRSQRPIYIGQNMMNGTYRRHYEGDYKCNIETIKQMVAEQINDTRDDYVQKEYTLNDIELTSFKAYRNLFNNLNLNHPWSSYDDQGFLEMIGGWSQNRETGKEGLTLAGILMFGKMLSITDVLPNYFVDYQEQSDKNSNVRWIDRITPDGTWSSNLFDFYFKVIRKLTADLKIPFKLKGNQRIEDTPVHEALREALVNTLIHADYTDRLSVLIIKRPDMFSFRNPGAMRVSIKKALSGGESDCRNRNLQKMFRLISLGEQAGSGIPKIYKNWTKQHWRTPLLYDKFDPDQTVLELRMLSLLPEEIIEKLDKRFGDIFRTLTEVERLALATAEIEGKLTHSRLCDITTDHPHDLSKSLSGLVQKGFLIPEGVGRGTLYKLPEKVSSVHLNESSVHLSESSVHLDKSSVHLEITKEEFDKLRDTAEKVRVSKKVNRNIMENKILQICSQHYISLKMMSELLGRKADVLRIHYLGKLAKEGKLVMRYPDKPNHPEQAYKKGL